MRFVALFLIVLVCDAPAVARDIYVATNGNDGNTGGPGDPYRTIKYAVGQSIAGDVIHVRAGTYAESWIVIHSGTRVISEDGLYAAKIYSQNSSAVRLTQNDCGIEGFEIYGNWNGGTSPGDGLVRPYASNNTWAKDCLIHDAPLDQDVVKIGANNVLIENCVIYNPSPRTTSGYQECIDVYGTPVPDGVTIRGCWVYHTVERGGDYLTYAKGGSRNILWENNVFGPAASGPSGNCRPQQHLRRLQRRRCVRAAQRQERLVLQQHHLQLRRRPGRHRVLHHRRRHERKLLHVQQHHPADQRLPRLRRPRQIQRHDLHPRELPA
jgi:hypothetical protein